MDDISIKGYDCITTNDVFALDFAEYVIYDIKENNIQWTAVVGGNVPITRIYFIDETKCSDEEACNWFSDYENLEQFLHSHISRDDGVISIEAIFKYVPTFIKYFKSNSGYGLEPAIIAGNASINIFGAEFLKEHPDIYVPYIHQNLIKLDEIPEEFQQYYESYDKLFPQKVLAIKDKDFGIAIHGDAMHVSALIVKFNKKSEHTELRSIIKDDIENTYVFDSIGDIHFQTNNGTIFNKFIVLLDAENNGVIKYDDVKSLNPFGLCIQKLESDSCGLWSSNTLAEISRYDNFNDFILTCNCTQGQITALKNNVILNIAKRVVKQEQKQDTILMKIPTKQELNEYDIVGTINEYPVYIKKTNESSVDIDNIRKYINTNNITEKYNNLTTKLNELRSKNINKIDLTNIKSHIDNIEAIKQIINNKFELKGIRLAKNIDNSIDIQQYPRRTPNISADMRRSVAPGGK